MIRTRLNLDPTSDLYRFADMMDRMLAPVEATPNRLSVPIDVFETNGNLVLRAAVPGIKPEDIEVTVESNVLTLSGEHRSTFETKDAKVYRLENQFGSFTRSIRLPKDVQADKIEAEFANGVITVTIPRVEPVKPEPVRVPVRSAKVIEAPETVETA
jgi:HSP20 family protein